MKLVRSNGGYSIAVYQKSERSKVSDLIANNRVNFIELADYSEDSDLDKTVKTILRKMASENYLVSRTNSQLKKFRQKSRRDDYVRLYWFYL